MVARDRERFESKTERDSGTGCLLWTASKSRNGYGLFKVDGRTRRVIRWIFEQDHGYLPPVVMHLCDTPACVELTHLIPGTPAENVADMVAKGRQAKGELHARCKLTDQQVWEIRTEYEKGVLTQRALAEAYGVSDFGIRYALKGRKS